MNNQFLYKTILEIWTDIDPDNLMDYELIALGYTTRNEPEGIEITSAPTNVQHFFQDNNS